MTRFLHSRIAPIVIGALAAIWVIALAIVAPPPCPGGGDGLVGSWPTALMAAHPAVNVALGLALNLALAAALAWVCGEFNLLRSITRLQSSAFLMMQLAVPSLMAYAAVPTVMALAVVVCMALMFSVYGQPGPLGMRRVMMVFFILSAGSAFAWECLIYVPVMLLACAQMRVMTLRGLLAAVMGLAGPWVIILGLGLATPADVQWPARAGVMLSALGAPAMAATALTGFAVVAYWLLNVMKYLTYNARSRAMISVVTVVSLVTVLAAAVDYAYALAFEPLLCVCAALQMGHLFGVMYTRRKSWIAIALCWLPFVLISLWSALPSRL